MLTLVNLKTAPELKRVILAACPSYKKRTAYLSVREEVRLSDTYWSGGTRYDYTAVNLTTLQAGTAPRQNPYLLCDSANVDPVAHIVPGACIVKHGTSEGKPATAWVCIHPDNATKLIPA